MADIATLSKLLEASLDPRQNKQGKFVFVFMLPAHLPAAVVAYLSAVVLGITRPLW